MDRPGYDELEAVTGRDATVRPSRILEADLDGGNLHPIIDFDGIIHDFGLSQHVYYVGSMLSGLSSSTNIWRSNADGSAIEHVLELPGSPCTGVAGCNVAVGIVPDVVPASSFRSAAVLMGLLLAIGTTALRRR